MAGPFYLYFYYRDMPEICKAVTYHKINIFPDLTEQIVSRYDFVHTPAYLAVVNDLFFDKERNAIRRGAGGKGPGSPRHLVRVVDQLAMTRDFYGSEDADSLKQVLPKVFREG